VTLLRTTHPYIAPTLAGASRAPITLAAAAVVAVVVEAAGALA